MSIASTRRATLAAIVLVLAIAPSAQAFEVPVLGAVCDGLAEVVALDVVLCSHGPDQHLGADRTAAAPAGKGAGPSLPSLPAQCIGTGQDGNRVAVLAIDVAGQAAADVDVRRWAGQVDWTFQASAERDGGRRNVRWVTERASVGGCQVAVEHVELSMDQVRDFEDMVSALAELGYAAPDRKYLAYVATDVGICGIGTVSVDDRPAGNLADSRTGYARVDRDCWAAGDEGVYSVAAHELAHTLGSVQATAPNATDGFHCSDEWDVMCYSDGSAAMTFSCLDPDGSPTDAGDENNALLDCNGDDYFNAGRAQGWLATHWNIANSAHLTATEGTGAGYSSTTPMTTQSTGEGRVMVVSPTFGQHGPVVREGYGWEACNLPITVEVADGPPTTSRSNSGVLGLGGSSTETTPSASELRTSVARAVDWVNDSVGRQVLDLDADGIEPGSRAAESPSAGTLVLKSGSTSAVVGARAVPTHVKLRSDDGRIASAVVTVHEAAAAPRLDTWVAQGLAQALGLGRSGPATDLMATWPSGNPDRTVAGNLLDFLYGPGSCTQDRRVRDTGSGHASQRRAAGDRTRLDLAVGQNAPVAVAVATAGWLRAEQGGQWADLVVICRDDVHVDCLAGSGLAGHEGPVLFVPGGRGGSLPASVRTEVLASMKANGTVYVLGGVGAVSSSVEQALRDAVPGTATVTRLSGPSRYSTATSIADEVLRLRSARLQVDLADQPSAVLARSDDPVDAVAAGAYAAAHRVPVLLTAPAALPIETATWLRTHGGKVVGIGGRSAINAATLDAAGSAAGAPAVRVSGPDRFATALAVSKDANLWGATTIDADAAYIVVNGRDHRTWAYALAAAPVAANLDAPVIFVERSSLPGVVATHLMGLPVSVDAPNVMSVTVGQGDFLAAGTVEAFHRALAPGFDGNVEA